MTPREYLDVVRERWRLIVAGLVLGLVAAGAVTVLVPPAYSAPVTVIVTPQPDPTLPQAGSGELSSQQISTYVQLIQSKRLAGDVILALGLRDTTADDLAKRVTVTTTPDSALITAAVEDGSSDQAVRVANGVAEQFIRNVAEIEQPADPARRPLVVANVFEPAQAPAGQTAPRPALYVLIGTVLGLLVGFAAALLRHALDTKIKRRRVLEDVLGVPALGTVDRDRRIRSAPLVMRDAPRTPLAEAFRGLRTNVRFVDVDRGHRLILVTSATAREGRSTTVCNLAQAFAESGSRVLVLDADLRSPTVARCLGIDEAPGLTDVLVDRVSVNWAVQTVGPGLDALPSGPLPPNPSELLGSKRMGEVLETLDDRYDIVLVDAPPLLPVTDAAVLAPQVDGVIVVVRYGRTGVPELSAAKEALDAVSGRVMGSVLTMVPGGRPGRRRGRKLTRSTVPALPPAPEQPEVVEANAPDELAIEETAVEETAQAETAPAGKPPAGEIAADGIAAGEAATARSTAAADGNGSGAAAAVDGDGEAGGTAPRKPRPSPAPRRGDRTNGRAADVTATENGAGADVLGRGPAAR